MTSIKILASFDLWSKLSMDCPACSINHLQPIPIILPTKSCVDLHPSLHPHQATHVLFVQQSEPPVRSETSPSPLSFLPLSILSTTTFARTSGTMLCQPIPSIVLSPTSSTAASSRKSTKSFTPYPSCSFSSLPLPSPHLRACETFPARIKPHTHRVSSPISLTLVIYHALMTKQ